MSTKIADALRSAANAAADKIEQMEIEIIDLRQQANGRLAPDGTPIADLYADLEGLRKENADLRRALRQISRHTEVRATERKAALAAIKGLCGDPLSMAAP